MPANEVTEAAFQEFPKLTRMSIGEQANLTMPFNTMAYQTGSIGADIPSQQFLIAFLTFRSIL